MKHTEYMERITRIRTIGRGSLLRLGAAAAVLAVVAVAGCSKEEPVGGSTGREVLVRLPGVSLAAPVEVTPGVPAPAVGYAASRGLSAGDGMASDTLQELFSVTLGSPAEDVPEDRRDAGSVSSRAGAGGSTAVSAGAVVAAPATRAEVALTNVWVFQFDAAGKTLRCEKVDALAAGRPLEVLLDSGEGFTIGVVANGPADGLSVSNVPDLTAFRSGLLFTGHVASDEAVPYAGTLDGVRVLDNGQVQVGGSAASVPVITLTRILARVTVALTHDVTGYALDGVELYSVPVGAAFAADPAAAAFPAGEDGNFGFRDNAAAGLAPHATDGGRYTWYIGPNRRGSGTGITKVQDKNAAKAPKYATYARVKTHNTSVTEATLYYDIFLGEDMLSDFNVTANHLYSYTTRIVGSAEAHIALLDTDGRVSGRKPQHVGSAAVTPAGDIPGQGATYSVTLTGVFPAGGVEVRAQSNGTVLVSGKVTASGQAVSLAVPHLSGYGTRKVSFEYLWENQWTRIGDERTQTGYSVTKATHNAPAMIPAEGGTYTVTLTGWGAFLTQVVSGETVLASNTDNHDEPGKTEITRQLTVPANTGAEREIRFQYRFNWAFTDIAPAVRQAKSENIDTGGGGTVIEPDPGKKVTWQNAIDYCKSKGEGWRLPTQNELMYYWCVEPSIPADSKFSAAEYWSATESSKPQQLRLVRVFQQWVHVQRLQDLQQLRALCQG